MYEVGQKYIIHQNGNSSDLVTLNGAKELLITGNNEISISAKSNFHPSLTMPYEFFDTLGKSKKISLFTEAHSD